MRRWPLLAVVIGLNAVTVQAAGEDGAEPVPHALHYIVFQHQGYWDSPLRTAGPSEAKNSRGPTDKLDEDPFEGLWEKLSQSGSYRPLRQGLVVREPRPESEAEPLPVDGQWEASVRGPFLPLPGVLPPLLSLGSRAQIPTEDRLLGRLRFYKGRYAHLDVRLAFAESVRWIPGLGMEKQYHILDQSRRMLPGRTYYFDHPRLGVIARVAPLE